MTEHVLSVELTNLLQESRRKHPELKNVVESAKECCIIADTFSRLQINHINILKVSQIPRKHN